jgi:maleylacetate reductase
VSGTAEKPELREQAAGIGWVPHRHDERAPPSSHDLAWRRALRAWRRAPTIVGMPTFQYANPAVIHWGEGSVAAELDRELERRHARRVMLVTTRSAVEDARLAPAIEAILGVRLAARHVVGQHAPVRAVMDGVHAARAASPDAIVSLGGGSPIDAAKAIAFSLATGIDLTLPDAQARGRGAALDGVVPHLAIPTTLSVAELAASAGFAAEGTREKVGVAAPALRPAAVMYDATLAIATPLELWLSTGIRAVDHAVETLLAPGEHPLPDAAALDGLRRLKAGLLGARQRPGDLAARTECQLGAWFSYLLPVAASRGLSHVIGKRIGSPYGIPHGVTSCLILPHVLRRLAPRAPPAARRIAEALGAPDAAAGVAELVEALGLPRHLAAYGLSDADLAAAARDVATPDHPEDELLGILRDAL